MKRLILGLLLMVVACSPDVPADATGEQIFRQICANCHAQDLTGGLGPALGPGSNAAAETDEYLILTITRGRGQMPSFQRTLSEAQILRVVEYIREVQSG